GIWYMNNNVFVGAFFGPTFPLGWDLFAVGDFNGDGHPDFVLRGGAGFQQTGIWYMNNNVFVGALFGPTLPFGWWSTAKLSIFDCVADSVWLTVPQPTERQHVGNQINAATIFARAEFVDVREQWRETCRFP